MSETETEREVEIVTGTIKGVIVKGVDKWQVEVQPDGSEYTKKLWTKDAELVAAIPPKIGQHTAIVCNASYWEKDGKQIRSLWISGEADGSESADRVATPAAAPLVATTGSTSPQPAPANQQMSKEEWARKDSAIHKMACIKTAAAALTHTMPADPTPEDLNKFNDRVIHLSLAFHRSVLAERDDPTGESVPF